MTRAEPDEIEVLIVDDDPLARRAIRTILAADPAIHVVAEAADGRAACEAAETSAPDVVLMDVRMPRQDGLSALTRLTQQRPGLPVIMLTTFSDRDAIDQALIGGAAGFLLKTSDPDELTRSVHSAYAGGLVLSPSVARWVVGHWAPRASADADARRAVSELTARQRDVLESIADGRSNAEIGRALYLSEGTVKGYVSELIATLNVRNRVEAAILFNRATGS